MIWEKPFPDGHFDVQHAWVVQNGVKWTWNGVKRGQNDPGGISFKKHSPGGRFDVRQAWVVQKWGQMTLHGHQRQISVQKITDLPLVDKLGNKIKQLVL